MLYSQLDNVYILVRSYQINQYVFCRERAYYNDGLRYDCVSGVHPSAGTPVYVTYNSGHAYPKYLITYKRRV